MGFLSGLLSPVLGAVGTSFSGPIGGALGSMVGSAIAGGGAGSGGAGTPGSAVAAADPFAAQRGQYQQSLQQLMQGKFTPTDPSYQFRLDQGTEAVNRGAAASGLLRSGNRLAELMQYGQNLGSTEYGNQFQRLALLSGAEIGSPATAAGLIQGNLAGSTAAGMKLGQGVGEQVGGWLQDWMSPSSGGDGYSAGPIF